MYIYLGPRPAFLLRYYKYARQKVGGNEAYLGTVPCAS